MTSTSSCFFKTLILLFYFRTEWTTSSEMPREAAGRRPSATVGLVLSFRNDPEFEREPYLTTPDCDTRMCSSLSDAYSFFISGELRGTLVLSSLSIVASTSIEDLFSLLLMRRSLSSQLMRCFDLK